MISEQEINKLEAKVQWSGFDRSEGVKVIMKLIQELRQVMAESKKGGSKKGGSDHKKKPNPKPKPQKKKRETHGYATSTPQRILVPQCF